MFTLPNIQPTLPFFETSSFRFNSETISSAVARIQEVVSRTLEKIFSFVDSYDVYSNDISPKTFALIGCLSLVALIVISLLRKKEDPSCRPDSPYPFARHYSTGSISRQNSTGSISRQNSTGSISRQNSTGSLHGRGLPSPFPILQ